MKPQVISFHYTLKDKAGKQIESSHDGEPVVCLEGGGQIIPALERALSGLKTGEKKEVALKAADAYGLHDKSLIIDVPKEQLPKGKEALKVGHQFQSQGPDGNVQVFTVKALNAASVTLDGNH